MVLSLKMLESRPVNYCEKRGSRGHLSEQIVLGVKEENIAAIRVYEQAGFLTYKAERGENESENVGFQTMIFLRDKWYQNISLTG